MGFLVSQISTSLTWLGTAVLLTYFGVVMIDNESVVGRKDMVAVGGGGESIIGVVSKWDGTGWWGVSILPSWFISLACSICRRYFWVPER